MHDLSQFTNALTMLTPIKKKRKHFTNVTKFKNLKRQKTKMPLLMSNSSSSRPVAAQWLGGMTQLTPGACEGNQLDHFP